MKSSSGKQSKTSTESLVNRLKHLQQEMDISKEGIPRKKGSTSFRKLTTSKLQETLSQPNHHTDKDTY